MIKLQVNNMFSLLRRFIPQTSKKYFSDVPNPLSPHMSEHIEKHVAKTLGEHSKMVQEQISKSVAEKGSEYYQQIKDMFNVRDKKKLRVLLWSFGIGGSTLLVSWGSIKYFFGNESADVVNITLQNKEVMDQALKQSITLGKGLVDQLSQDEQTTSNIGRLLVNAIALPQSMEMLKKSGINLVSSMYDDPEFRDRTEKFATELGKKVIENLSNDHQVQENLKNLIMNVVIEVINQQEFKDNVSDTMINIMSEDSFKAKASKELWNLFVKTFRPF